MKDFLKEKISDSILREFAEDGEKNERRSIIVELDAPARSSSLVERKENYLEKTKHIGLTNRSTFDDDEENFEKDSLLMNELEKNLSDLDLIEDPIRLEHAQAFVMNVTPKQLRALSKLSLTGVIRPNRVHNIPEF